MSMGVASAGANVSAAATSAASANWSPTQKFSGVFSQIDTSGSGSITKSQFEQAFSSLKMPASFRAQGADAVFAQLDPTNSGSVSKADFVSGMTQQLQAARANRASAASGVDITAATSGTASTTATSATSLDTLLQSLVNGTSSKSNTSSAALLQDGLGTLLDQTV